MQGGRHVGAFDGGRTQGGRHIDAYDGTRTQGGRHVGAFDGTRTQGGRHVGVFDGIGGRRVSAHLTRCRAVGEGGAPPGQFDGTR
eukprot:5019932-Prymnesium_polylepis.1